MKLYFSPGACSLSPHIALREAGLKFDLERVDTKTKQTADGADYRAINPKGAVPALALDEGGVLTEGPAIVQYIADKAPGSKLAPANGTLERYRLQEWLGFVNSEIHKAYSPLFNPKATDEAKAAQKETLAKKYEFVEKALAGKTFLTGDTFTVADGYLFVVTRWAGFTGVDLSKFPHVQAFMERVGARPAVKAAIDAENALKAKV